MNVFLVAGNFHPFVSRYVTEIVNCESVEIENAISFIQSTHIEFDLLMVVDEALSRSPQIAAEQIENIREKLLALNNNATILVVTNRELLKKCEHQGIIVKFYDYTLIPFDCYSKAVDCCRTMVGAVSQSALKPKSFHGFGGKLKGVGTKHSDSEMVGAGISKGISRVVAVTGHRGSGVTGTAVNLAVCAAQKELTSVIVDLDVDFRSVNVYFGGFSERAETDENISASLIRTLAQPQNFDLTTYSAGNKLNVTTLPYSFDDSTLVDKFFVPERIIGMLSVLRQNFNLCILDFPFEVMSKMPEVMIHIDNFALCVKNNLYSVINTVRNVGTYFDSNYCSVLNTKAKIIVTQYSDKSAIYGEHFTPEKVCELLSSETFNNVFKFQMPLAGYVPNNYEYDVQIENDIPIAASNEKMKNSYNQILLRIMEGVN